MAAITYYVAAPFVLKEEGALVPGEAQDRQTASAAILLAEEMARRFGCKHIPIDMTLSSMGA